MIITATPPIAEIIRQPHYSHAAYASHAEPPLRRHYFILIIADYLADFHALTADAPLACLVLLMRCFFAILLPLIRFHYAPAPYSLCQCCFSFAVFRDAGAYAISKFATPLLSPLILILAAPAEAIAAIAARLFSTLSY